MSSSEVALRMRGVGKSYTIRSNSERHITIAEQALSRLRHPMRRDSRTTFWALRDLDLEVPEGGVLGIVGRNGAGKSTLLKVLSRISAPTTGSIELFGRIGSLLEVGTGFHPELTGRENIFLNGSILGMRRAEIEREFDAIVDFAGVATFLDTPVKRYSSGMYVRLAFAVAAHLRTEILLVDEVLAVGDADFQNRCIGKMRDVADGGRSVLFVSHNMDTVLRLCDEAILLEHGQLALHGTTQEVVQRYAASFTETHDGVPLAHRSAGHYTVARITAPTVNSGEPLSFEFEIEAAGEGGPGRYFLSAHVVDDHRRVVAQMDSRLNDLWVSHSSGTKTFTLTMRTPWLRPGRYEVDVYVCNAGILAAAEPACIFVVNEPLPYDTLVAADAVAATAVLADFDYRQIEEVAGTVRPAVDAVDRH